MLYLCGMRKNTIKRAKQVKEYKVLRDKYLEDHPCCEVRLPGCTGCSEVSVHHKAGRENENLTNVESFLPVCFNCHVKITEDSNLAIEKGWSVRRIT